MFQLAPKQIAGLQAGGVSSSAAPTKEQHETDRICRAAYYGNREEHGSALNASLENAHHTEDEERSEREAALTIAIMRAMR
jgi:hypothetical protein